VTTLVDEMYNEDATAMLDALPERVILYRLADLTISYCNTAWAAQYKLEPDQAIGRPLQQFLTEDGLASLEFELARLGPDNPVLVDCVVRGAPNAPGQWVEWADRYLTGADGAEILAVGRDVTARHDAELKLAESEARFRHLADNSIDVVWHIILDPFPHFDYISPSVEKSLGYPPSFFLDDITQFLGILDDEGRAAIQRDLHGEPMPERYDFHFRHADGSIVVGETQITRLRGGLQGVSRDVTELRQIEAKVTALALRDPLTGLANRRLFFELLEADLARTQRSGLPLAVAFLDLDGLKQVNDTHGHDAGDLVLCETARRLVSIVRGADIVARFGGDEFAVVYEPNDPNSANLIERIDRALSTPIAINPTTVVNCPASIGIADTRTVGTDPTALLAAADDAMYEMKRARHAVARRRFRQTASAW
jgi:diguanylate cyclase (GGDEF)-like protein/PAS domain S-box-containing protein